MSIAAIQDSTSAAGLNSQKTVNPKSVMGEDGFLKLLVAQLEHQDPTNPLNNRALVEENVQFSSLEQLTNMDSAIENLTKSQKGRSFLTAANMIGKRVASFNQSILLSKGQAAPTHFNLDNDANVTAIITDKNNNVVRNDSLGKLTKGEHTFIWDGFDNSRTVVSNGTYNISFVATDSNGNSVNLSKDAGIVTGIGKSGSNIILHTNTGAILNLNEISSIYNVSGSTK